MSVPYVNVPASRERAGRLEQSGKWSSDKEMILGLLLNRGRLGATWKELAEITGMHHGQVSGLLSTLHKDGSVFSVKVQRNRCHPYFHGTLRHLFLDSERMDEPARTKASRNAEVVEIVEEILDLFDALPPLERDLAISMQHRVDQIRTILEHPKPVRRVG